MPAPNRDAFVAFTDFAEVSKAGDFTWSFKGDLRDTLDDAVDDYAEARDAGKPAIVKRLNLVSGLFEDVTKAATIRLYDRYRARRDYDLPEWLEADLAAIERTARAAVNAAGVTA